MTHVALAFGHTLDSCFIRITKGYDQSFTLRIRKTHDQLAAVQLLLASYVGLRLSAILRTFGIPEIWFDVNGVVDIQGLITRAAHVIMVTVMSTATASPLPQVPTFVSMDPIVRFGLASSSLLLRHAPFSPSETSKEIIGYQKGAGSGQVAPLKKELQQDRLMRGYMDEILQEIVPRLLHLLRQLLQHCRPLRLDDAYAQLACNVLCGRLLNEGLPGTCHSFEYVYLHNDQNTMSDIKTFRQWYHDTEYERTSYARTRSLKMKMDDLQEEHDKNLCQSRKQESALKNQIRALQDQLNASKDELPCTSSDLQRVQGELDAKWKKALFDLNVSKDELLCVRSELQRVRGELDDQRNASKDELNLACKQLKASEDKLISERSGASARDKELTAELDRTSEQLQRVQGELHEQQKQAESDRDASQKELACVWSELQKSQDGLVRARRELQHASSVSSGASARVEELTAELDRAGQQLQRIRGELHEKEVALQGMEADLWEEQTRNQRIGVEIQQLRSAQRAITPFDHAQQQDACGREELLDQSGADPEHEHNPQLDASVSYVPEYGDSVLLPTHVPVASTSTLPPLRLVKVAWVALAHEYTAQRPFAPMQFQAYSIQPGATLQASPEELEFRPAPDRTRARCYHHSPPHMAAARENHEVLDGYLEDLQKLVDKIADALDEDNTPRTSASCRNINKAVRGLQEVVRKPRNPPASGAAKGKKKSKGGQANEQEEQQEEQQTPQLTPEEVISDRTDAIFNTAFDAGPLSIDEFVQGWEERQVVSGSLEAQEEAALVLLLRGYELQTQQAWFLQDTKLEAYSSTAAYNAVLTFGALRFARNWEQKAKYDKGSFFRKAYAATLSDADAAIFKAKTPEEMEALDGFIQWKRRFQRDKAVWKRLYGVYKTFGPVLFIDSFWIPKQVADNHRSRDFGKLLTALQKSASLRVPLMSVPEYVAGCRATMGVLQAIDDNIVPHLAVWAAANMDDTGATHHRQQGMQP
ncbi:hypothetical protein B0H17DRAFT_1340983 [Mycena rosella]|uniref:Uncharacterized protein n=1 Tax=Mycena rosella TaxID=1033263 RepID=A0AAD7FFP7_MYCRO|nr:hypothetical protein B0H17DRAFT_1340983 [Mycena rosella]